MTDACPMPQDNPAPDEIARLLLTANRIAVVGLSPNPERPSHGVSLYMKAAGYQIVPVNPGHAEILGEKAYSSVAEVPGPVDVVQLFVAAERVPPIVDQAIAKGAKAVWMQSGIVNEAAAAKARAAGLMVVMNRCMKVEHARLGRR